MSSLVKYIKDHIVMTIVAIFLVFVAVAVVPLLINWMFTIPALFPLFAVQWEAKDALSYYGSALGFLGTVIFSALALWQNHIIQEANDKHTALLEEMERVKNAPHIVVNSRFAYGGSSKLRIYICNTSNNLAENLTASEFMISDKQGTILWKRDCSLTIDYLVDEKTWEIDWENPAVDNSSVFSFNLMFHDKFGLEHSYNAIGTMGSNGGLPKFKLREL